MGYRINGISREPFAHLFTLSEAELAEQQIVRSVASVKPGFPCRVTLRDAELGETLLLLPYEHHAASSPYRASGPIFVGIENGPQAACIDELPDVLRARPLSLRAYDESGSMVDADLATGIPDVEATITRFFTDDRVAYLHAHFARRGCFAARIDRA
jgi:hypothetical protein